MTISYSGNFVQLLLRWKGSIFRSVWKELLVWVTLYYLVRVSYTHAIPWADPKGAHKYRENFISVCQQCNEYTKLIPLTFLLGFYVSNVVSRWWRQFECLCWPEDLLSLLCFVVPADDMKQARKISQGCVWLTPLHWVQQIVSETVAESGALPAYVNNFNQEVVFDTLYLITTELKSFRISFRRLFCHDWVCVPLVYTQVAALATYAFFFFCLFGRQTIVEPETVDFRFPIFTVVQFLFFVGWFKVGQDLMRPFGLDDDDIELSYILDRNILTSFTIANTLQTRSPPPFEEDPYWKARHDPNVADSSLKYGRIDLSRANHKHPPKLHMLADLKTVDKQFVQHQVENGCALHDKMDMVEERKLLFW
ncbi:unnamed protein product, partial [Mesorhabditis spiculigera]